MEWLQWAVNAIVLVLGIIAGRAWQKYDRRSKKDEDLFNQILEIIPVDSDEFLWFRRQDFGGEFHHNLVQPIRNLRIFLRQPGHFFLERKTENIRVRLSQKIDDFLDIFGAEIFTKDSNPDYLELPEPHSRIRLWARNFERRPSKQEITEMVKEFTCKYDEARDSLNTLSSEICDTYDELVGHVRRQL